MKRVSRLVSRRLAHTSLFAVACVIGIAAQANAQTLGPLVQVTGSDPFSNCTADNVPFQETAFGSTLYPDTAIEPWVAADPTDTSRLLVGHQQDRWSDGGSRGLVGVVSNDANTSLTWSDTIPNDVTECTGGPYPRASDPWVTFAQDGTAFFFSLALTPSPSFQLGVRGSAMLVSRSTDHAATWEDPVTLIANDSANVLNDKNSITADPKQNGLVYAVWDQLRVGALTSQAAKLLAENDGVVIARTVVNRLRTAAAGGVFFGANFTGPTFFSRTTDNGDTWSTAVPIYQPGTNAQTIDNIVQVLPDGDVLDFFTAINVTPDILNIGYIRSTDKGVSWSGPILPKQTAIKVVGVVTPDLGKPVRDASILYSVAVNPISGAVYLAWQDDRFSRAACTTPTGSIKIDGIVFSQSLDNGAHWSTPVMINQTPSNATNPCRQQAFIPAVVASGDGLTVVVTYYDFRNDTPAGFEGTDYFALFCATFTDCTKVANWGNEKRLTTVPFNILNAPVAGGHFLGDYMGLAASGPTTVYPVFGIATEPNVTVEFTRRISGLP
jgi:hypothetical protein